jgi:hypothetical protein
MPANLKLYKTPENAAKAAIKALGHDDFLTDATGDPLRWFWYVPGSHPFEDAEGADVGADFATVEAKQEEPEPFEEPETPAAPMPGAEYGLTPEVIASIMAQAEQIGASKVKAKKPRANAAAKWMAEAEAGVMPTPPTFPPSNAYAQKTVDTIHSMVLAMDAEGLDALQIGGTNTYAKLTRAFRDACLAHILSLPAKKAAA